MVLRLLPYNILYSYVCVVLKDILSVTRRKCSASAQTEQPQPFDVLRSGRRALLAPIDRDTQVSPSLLRKRSTIRVFYIHMQVEVLWIATTRVKYCNCFSAFVY